MANIIISNKWKCHNWITNLLKKLLNKEAIRVKIFENV